MRESLQSPASAALRILSRNGRDEGPELTAAEWRRWAARIYSEAMEEQSIPALDGVPRSRALAESIGGLKLWTVCRDAHALARERLKRVALALAHDAVTRAREEPAEPLWGRLAEQYRDTYLREPGGDPEDGDEMLATVARDLADSQACARLSPRRKR